uniref:Gamma-glutamyltranspeptidase n=1 Tax=Haemonchus contortus TaxID=6289 RepID=A0A7I4XU89_HAECO
MILLIAGLLISTITFATLYFRLLGKDSARLPKWPKPSISPLGKYSRAAVAADNEYCSEIGRNILLQGGNAVDAAVAALFCIGVMDSHSAGLGGGHFMTIYNATTRQCTVIDAREVAPNAATEEMYENRWNKSRVGWRAVAVPGELHGLRTEFEKFGSSKVSWSDLIQPTIELLEEGFPTSHALAMALERRSHTIVKEPTMKDFLNPKTGNVYRAGDQIRTRTSLLRTLRHLANSSDPIREFYHGEMTREMAREFKRYGGILTEDDFSKYRSIVVPHSGVIYTTLSNNRMICGPPPPSGSAVAQAILNIMDGYKNDMKSFEDIAQFYHRFIESSKFAYAARTWLGDPAFVDNATEIAQNITSRKWAEWVRSKITEETHPDEYYGGSLEAPAVDHGTTHISVIDIYGNAVSVTSTINLYLGAAVTSPSTGILWNDEMDDFSTPHHPNTFGIPPSPANFIRPGKRPMSSQSPLIIFDKSPGRNAKRVLVVGGAGGSTIISGVAGVALHNLYLKANVKQAVDAPRLHNQLYPNSTSYEPNFPQAYLTELESRGHILKKVQNLTVVTAAERAADGQLYANSDFRKGEESSPAGY